MHDMLPYTDEELVIRYREGNDEAFTALVDRYLKPAYNFSIRLGAPARDAEEIVQESFVKLWKNIDSFRAGEKFKTWFYTIVRNATIDVMRRKRHVLLSAFEDEEGNNPVAERLVDEEKLAHEIFESAENAAAVEQLVGELPDKYRAVVVLRYREEMEFEEIGKILKKPLNTVKSQHRRALIALRKKMSDAPKNRRPTYEPS
ncbi:MAG: sigma-70 family RNA polymerase sigma factor [Patescibacteria group bacterium]|nr:sigma-70 family RNA polymerase sigma factor [Patescibacteria group bacterium]MDE1945952.1 sigma-70 family RNA polymerase sigma factor [Patescibacteria group bacterium]